MLKSESREIDGMSFTVTQLPATKQFRLQAWLALKVGPGIVKALSGVDLSGGAKSLSKVDLGEMADGVAMLCDRLSADDFEKLWKELLEGARVKVDGNSVLLKDVFEVVMVGKFLTLLKLIRFAMEVNFGSFFDVLRGLTLRAQEVTSSQSPNT
jgi:hypothetical protein